MTAIVGLFRTDGVAAHPEDLASAHRALIHRGAAERTWAHGPMALTQRSPSHEGSTLFAHGLSVVADARIDNREELARSLGIANVHEIADSELIALAYRRWRQGCVDELLGDFAFAIWDDAARTLFCGRDPMGVKAFYYFRSDRFFAFATELKSLFALPNVPREIDESALSSFIAMGPDDRSATIYERIHRLPAAHTLTVRRDGIRLDRYWDPAPRREIRFASPQQYVDAFQELFLEAVRVRIPADGLVGSTLSGGLDSSSIVCTARRFVRSVERLHTFSLVFPGLPADELRRTDERRYVEAVVERTGVQPHFVRGDLISPLSDMGTVLEHVGQPYRAPNLYLHWAMYRAAGESGVGVLLDGLDGDVAVGHGLGHLNTYARRGDWAGFESLARGFAARRKIQAGAVLPHYGLPYLDHLAQNGRLMQWGRGARHFARRFDVSRTDLIYNHGLKPMVSRMTGRATAQDADFLDHEVQYTALMQPEYQLMLETADVCAAAHGVEPRYPFFDRRLIEFCLALPEEQKFGDGWTRLVLRRAMEGILPPAVQWRTDKSNLSPNFHRGLRNADAAALESIDTERLAVQVDPNQVATTRQRYLRGHDRAAQEADGLLLFRLAVLSAWLDRGASESMHSSRRTMHTAAHCAV